MSSGKREDLWELGKGGGWNKVNFIKALTIACAVNMEEHVDVIA